MLISNNWVGQWVELISSEKLIQSRAKFSLGSIKGSFPPALDSKSRVLCLSCLPPDFETDKGLGAEDWVMGIILSAGWKADTGTVYGISSTQWTVTCFSHGLRGELASRQCLWGCSESGSTNTACKETGFHPLVVIWGRCDLAATDFKSDWMSQAVEVMLGCASCTLYKALLSHSLGSYHRKSLLFCILSAMVLPTQPEEGLQTFWDSL